eukprot:40282_1
MLTFVCVMRACQFTRKFTYFYSGQIEFTTTTTYSLYKETTKINMVKLITGFVAFAVILQTTVQQSLNSPNTPTRAPTPFCAYLSVTVLDANGTFNDEDFDGLYTLSAKTKFQRPIWESIDSVNYRTIRYLSALEWIIQGTGDINILFYGSNDLYPPINDINVEWYHSEFFGIFHVLIECIKSYSPSLSPNLAPTAAPSSSPSLSPSAAPTFTSCKPAPDYDLIFIVDGSCGLTTDEQAMQQTFLSNIIQMVKGTNTTPRIAYYVCGYGTSPSNRIFGLTDFTYNVNNIDPTEMQPSQGGNILAHATTTRISLRKGRLNTRISKIIFELLAFIQITDADFV